MYNTYCFWTATIDKLHAWKLRLYVHCLSFLITNLGFKNLRNQPMSWISVLLKSQKLLGQSIIYLHFREKKVTTMFIRPYLGPNKTSPLPPILFLRTVSITSSHLYSGLPCNHFLDFLIKIMLAFLLCPARVTRSIHLTLFDLITLIKSGG